MSDEAYDRYRAALRDGHLAGGRGDHIAAITAYREAAGLAPGRPLPLIGLGSALQADGRHAEALDAFGQALQLAPLDEAALRGRGASLVALGRSQEAAAALTGLAESLEADGRAREALELAREALALASTPTRFRLVARLSSTVRLQAQETAPPASGSNATPGGVSDESGTGVEAADAAAAAVVAIPPPTPGVSFGAEADLLADQGQLSEARDRYLLAARAYQDEGHLLAALDACYAALAIAPADPDLHLALAGLYEARGWLGPAVDKLVLLARLLDLAGDAPARQRLCALVAERFQGEPRLAALCP